MHIKDISNFREFYLSTDILKESPSVINRKMSDNLNDAGFNQKTAMLIVDRGSDAFEDFSTAQLVGGVKVDVRGILVSLDLHRVFDKTFDYTSDWFLDVTPSVNALVRYKVHNDSLIMIFAGNYNRTMNRLVFWLLINYYLKQYKSITSDRTHTPDGKHLWERLINYCKATHKITIVDNKTGNEIPIDLSNSEKYWSTDSNCRIKIYAS